MSGSTTMRMAKFSWCRKLISSQYVTMVKPHGCGVQAVCWARLIFTSASSLTSGADATSHRLTPRDLLHGTTSSSAHSYQLADIYIVSLVYTNTRLWVFNGRWAILRGERAATLARVCMLTGACLHKCVTRCGAGAPSLCSLCRPLQSIICNESLTV